MARIRGKRALVSCRIIIPSSAGPNPPRPDADSDSFDDGQSTRGALKIICAMTHACASQCCMIRKLQARMYSATTFPPSSDRRRKSFSGRRVIFRNGRIPFLWRTRAGAHYEGIGGRTPWHLETRPPHKTTQVWAENCPRIRNRAALVAARSHDEGRDSTRYASTRGHPPAAQ